METGTLQIKNIFGKDIRYIVPLFQRPYVWDKEPQWEPLWDDVRSLAERLEQEQPTTAHFLGAIVLDQMLKALGHLETRWVIDGQQRLTTIQLLMEAFADLCEERGEERLGKALRKLTRNDDPMSEDEDEEFKVWPTNADQEHFRRVMRAGSPSEVRESYGRSRGALTVGHRIGDAYLYFHRELVDWLHPEEDEWRAQLTALYTAIREQLRMVVIDLAGDDDPQLIFETLNARGTPLLPSDLVKNFLFHRVRSSDGDLEKLYRDHWEPFDAEMGYWRKEIARGRLKRPRLDIFLQYYLTLRTGHEVLVAHLYKSFQSYIEDGSASAAEELAAIRKYAETFQSFDRQPARSRERAFFDRLAALDTSTAYPFLLELYALHGQQPDEIRAVLVDLESFLVRRMICRLTTKNYNRMFVDLLGVLADEAKGSVSTRVREALLRFEGDSTRWPREEELRRAWLEEPAFQRQARRRVVMVLEALEAEMHSDKTEKFQLDEKLTVEHVLPQDWRKHWPLPDGDSSEAAELERNRLLHSFGNLTLVTKKLNPSISNGPWEKKREALAEHSVLRMNARLQKRDEWNDAAIRERSEETFEIARRLWPLPGTQ